VNIFPLNTREGEHRQVNDSDDGDAEDGGCADLLAGAQDGVQALFLGQETTELVLPMGQHADHILRHDYSSIHDQAEVHCTETHKIARYAVANHARHGEKHGKGNGGGDNQRRAPVPKQADQDRDHEDGSLKQILLDRADGRINQVGAVIHRFNLHAVG
jgi:hypothetical protein